MNALSGNGRADLRRQKIAAREALGEAARREKSSAIVRRILALPAFRDAGTVMLYRAVGGEVMLDGLPSLAPDKRYVYPRCLAGREMEALAPANGEAWRTGAYGIPEPDPDLSERVEPGDIDLVICPCTAFDAAGSRLGMGGGYYDRFLPRCGHANIIAVAFEVQRAEHIPAEPWDRKVDTVITEEI